MSQSGALDNEDVYGPAQILGDASILESLQGVVASVREAIEAVDYADMMLVISGEIHSAVVTDEEIVTIDEVQLASQDGPAIQALQSGRICRIASSNSSGQWPDFREACRRRGIMSMVTFPLVAEGVVHGVLSLYSRDYHAFGPEETRVGRALAAEASQVIGSVVAPSK
jgi:transcriptional regulator with GAF, ATPase, and Fis domain